MEIENFTEKKKIYALIILVLLTFLVISTCIVSFKVYIKVFNPPFTLQSFYFVMEIHILNI